MATISGVSLSNSTRILAVASDPTKAHRIKLNHPWKRSNQFGAGRMLYARPVSAVPEGLSEKVEKSIKEAEEACAGDPVSGECAAAWDEVEELSAAISHAKDKKKESNPLETFCEDNPENEECRTYDN